MQPRIETLHEKKLVGIYLTMSFAGNKTRELWQSFMPQRKLIDNTDTSLYSVEVYPHGFFTNFNTHAPFTKWAAMAVSANGAVPAGMHTLIIPMGLYAVFIHKGPASEGARTYEYIFRTWLPSSAYQLDDRPHFARMGDKYKHEDPTSEEEIWIPVRGK